MKKRICLPLKGIYGIALLLSTTANAQTNQPIQDTILTTLQSGEKILFIGDDLMNMRNYQKADSIKVLFLTDWTKAIETGQLNYDMQKVHYFVNENGVRRLKAEDISFSNLTVDVSAEIKRLKLNLPKYCLTLYDIKEGFRLEIYTNNPESLKTNLENTNIDLATQLALTSKRQSRRYFSIYLEQEGAKFNITQKNTNCESSFEVSPLFGLTLLGRTPSPVIGVLSYFSLYSKYGAPFMRLGFAYTGTSIINFTENAIAYDALISSNEIRIMINTASHSPNVRPNWMGVSGGYVTCSDKANLFHDSYKFGIWYNNGGAFSYGYEIYNTNVKKDIHAVSIMYTF